MDNIRAIVVDDEEGARNVLSSLIARSETNIEVVAHASDLPSAVEKIKQFKPHVVFLDVEMPKYSGYEIVDFIEDIDFDIVFVTAYNDYAIKAFEISAIDYLLKPVNRQRLEETLKRVKDNADRNKSVSELKELVSSIKNQEVSKIAISEIGGKRFIEINSIIAIEASGAYSNIHTDDGKTITVSKNLGHFESILPDDAKFFRSHKSWLINLDKIKGYSRNQGKIDLENDIEAKLSKYRASAFDEMLNN